MSFDEFATILRNAADLIRLRHGRLPGVAAILDRLVERGLVAFQRGRESRDIFFEPWMVAQQLGVPQASVEVVADRLQAMGILHIWARVLCPNTDDGGAIAFETDSDEVLEVKLSEPCRHCGAFHADDVASRLETVYAFNLADESPEPLHLSAFF